MYSNILVPVSFETDRDTQGALDVAKALCADDGKITLMHVVEQLPQYAMTYISKELLDKADAEMRAELAAMVADVDGGETALVHGHSARTILDYAEEAKSDLIIVASHRPGMQDLLLGSTAAKVVRHATCAVHVIR